MSLNPAGWLAVAWLVQGAIYGQSQGLRFTSALDPDAILTTAEPTTIAQCKIKCLLVRGGTRNPERVAVPLFDRPLVLGRTTRARP